MTKEFEIVWRSPVLVFRAQHELRRIRSDRFGALYAVTHPDLVQEFELILGDAA